MSKQMPRAYVLLLAFALLTGLFSGCRSDQDISEPSSEVIGGTGVSESEGTEPSGDNLLEIPTDASEGTSSTSRGTAKTSGGVSTTTTKARPKPGGTISIPTVTEIKDDKNAVLPQFTITNKEITVCMDWSPSSEWVQRWLIAFNHYYPGVKVKWKQAIAAEKATKLAIWKNSDQSPDVIYLQPEESWPTLANANLLEPLESYINENTAFWGSVREAMNSLKLGGKQYTMVSTSAPWGSVIYKRDLFTSKGMDDPMTLVLKDQWTWEKFLEYAKKLTKPNASDPSKSVWGCYVKYGQFIGTTGKDYIGYDAANQKWVSNLNDSGVKATIDFITQLGPTGLKLAPNMDGVQARDMVKSGQIGMMITAEDFSFEFPAESKDGSLRRVPIPRYTPSKTYYHPIMTEAYSIPKGAKNPTGGVAFACAVRAAQILPNAEEINYGKYSLQDQYTAEQTQLNKYADSVITGVVMNSRRLMADGVDHFEYWAPGFVSGKSWSSVVAGLEPRIMELLKKY